MADVCAGCEHSLTSHFVCVTGAVRCLVSHSGVSSSGVMGIPYTHACDCINYQSEDGNSRRAEREAKRGEQNEFRDRITADIRAAHPEMFAKLAALRPEGDQ